MQLASFVGANGGRFILSRKSEWLRHRKQGYIQYKTLGVGIDAVHKLDLRNATKIQTSGLKRFGLNLVKVQGRVHGSW